MNHPGSGNSYKRHRNTIRDRLSGAAPASGSIACGGIGTRRLALRPQGFLWFQEARGPPIARGRTRAPATSGSPIPLERAPNPRHPTEPAEATAASIVIAL